MLDHILRVIAPHICCACGEQSGVLCKCCYENIKDEAFACCVVCLRPTAATNLCPACRPHAPFDDAWVAAWREDAVKTLINAYKFERQKAAADTLAQLLADRLPCLPASTVVCAIPDIASHRRQRGYDHMALVAQKLARRRGWEYRSLLGRRTQLPQRGVSRKERLIRQNGAFCATETPSAPLLLIDDVYTTGATLGAGVAALRARCSGPIYLAVVARQPLD